MSPVRLNGLGACSRFVGTGQYNHAVADNQVKQEAYNLPKSHENETTSPFMSFNSDKFSLYL